ncbi:MAG: hypothetical protein B7W95_00285 [Acidimicrobiales bacterium 20-64-4]|nr:MAG: hypothetical protein B7W95_00285 [Acidimicrobiales bacterium 20-64-4]
MTEEIELTRSAALDPREPSDAASTPRRRFRKLRFAVITLGTALVAIAALQLVTNSPTTSTRQLSGPSGTNAIDFSLPSVTGSHDVLSLRRFQDRPLVINFWASWCVPCRTEMPLLEKAYLTEGGKIAFVGIDTNDTPTAARAFLNQVHVSYPTASDTTGSLAVKYGLFGLPTTLFVSAKGVVLGRHIGQFYANTLRAALHQAFNR